MSGPDGGRLALVDVDGTLTEVSSSWQYLLERCGCWTGKGEVNLARFLAGAIDYDEFCRLDAALLAGRRYAELQEIARGVPLRPGLDAFFACLRAAGYRIALVSTGLRVLTGQLCERYPVDWCVANDFEVVDGRCTGRAVVEIGDEDKGPHGRRLIAESGASHVLAIGDSVGDLPMFAAADLSVAVGTADPAVLAAVDVHLPGRDLAELCAHLDHVHAGESGGTPCAPR